MLKSIGLLASIGASINGIWITYENRFLGTFNSDADLRGMMWLCFGILLQLQWRDR